MSAVNCWSCGAPNPANAEFCEECGVDLSSQEDEDISEFDDEMPPIPVGTGVSFWARQEVERQQREAEAEVQQGHRGYNVVERVTLTGGFMGIAKTRESAIQNGMDRLSASGYRVVLVEQDDFSLREEILYFLILIFTLFIWTRLPGYIIVGERSDRVSLD